MQYANRSLSIIRVELHIARLIPLPAASQLDVHGFLLHRSWMSAFIAAADFFDRKLKK